MSRKIIIPGVTFTGPALKDDPIINAGSLLLVDVNHPTSPWASVPAAGTLVSNVARAQAATLIGSTAAGDLSPVAQVVGNVVPTFTSKGSLRLPVADATTGYHIKYPTAMIAYVKANPTHLLGMTLWAGLDGPSGAQISGVWSFLTTDANSVASSEPSAQSRFSPTATAPNSTGSSWVASVTGPTVVGPRRLAVASGTADDNGATVKVSQQASRIIGSGNVPATPALSRIPAGTGASVIFHRFYLEDLTVSGRSLADLAAADASLYNIAFGTGGRYSDSEYTRS